MECCVKEALRPSSNGDFLILPMGLNHIKYGIFFKDVRIKLLNFLLDMGKTSKPVDGML